MENKSVNGEVKSKENNPLRELFGKIKFSRPSKEILREMRSEFRIS